MATRRGPLQKVNYCGDTYSLFDDVQDFATEIAQSKQAILKTSFASIRTQVRELFQVVRAGFGDASSEALAVSRAKLYCVKCGNGFKSYVLALLIGPEYTKGPSIPTACTGCGSTELLYLYRTEEKRATLAIIMIHPRDNSPETVKRALSQDREIDTSTIIAVFEGPPRVDKGLIEALLVRYGSELGVSTIDKPHGFYQSSVGQVDYVVAKVY